MRCFAASWWPCLALILAASPLRADLLFSQPVVNGGVGLASDFAHFQQEADNFTLSLPGSVQTVHWWGAYANNAVQADSFTLRFFSDVAGSPATVPSVSVSAMSLTRTLTTLVDNLGDPIYEYQADLPSAAVLKGSTTYYLSVVNNTPPGGVWDWVGSGPGDHWARQDDASAWTASSNTTNFAFELVGGPVPEPGTVILLGCGIVGLLAYCRGRRRA
jgi:hypothetical protein